MPPARLPPVCTFTTVAVRTLAVGMRCKSRRHQNPWLSGSLVIWENQNKTWKFQIFHENNLIFSIPWFSRSPDLAASIGIEISGLRLFPAHFMTNTCFLTYFLKRKIQLFLQTIWNVLSKPRFSRSPDLAASIGIEISSLRPVLTHFTTKTCFVPYLFECIFEYFI